MADDNVQLLGGALIVLSLALLYCWWKKNSKKTLRVTGGYSKYRAEPKSRSFTTANEFEGMRSLNLQALDFEDTKPVSMHDIEGLANNRVIPGKEQLRQDVTGLRWQVEGMQAKDDTAAFDGFEEPDYSNMRAKSFGMNVDPSSASIRELKGDIETPLRPSQNSACNSHSHDQLTMVDNAMEFGNRDMYWNDARSSSVVSL